MSGTNTAEKKGNKKGNKSKQSDAVAMVAPVEIEPNGEAIETRTPAPADGPVSLVAEVQAPPGFEAPKTSDTPTSETPKAKRTNKNGTNIRINPADVNSGRLWLEEFYARCEQTPATKGYDQHWNKDGFVHTGPSTRLPSNGAANMVTFLGDILAQRQLAGDTEAGAYLDYCIAFLTTHRQALQEKREADILAAAAAIQAKKNA